MRELWDLGERTLEGSILRESARGLAEAPGAAAVLLAAVVVVVLARFLGRSRVAPMFSLSDWLSISVLGGH